jgi:outer membrane protein
MAKRVANSIERPQPESMLSRSQNCGFGNYSVSCLRWIEFNLVAIVLALLATAAAAPPSAGQTGENQEQTELTLARALEMADAHYPRIRAALEQQIAAKSGIGVARTAYLPRVDTLWQSNRATANNIYGLLLPQGIIPSISGPVIASDNGRSAWSSAGGALVMWQPFDFGLRAAQVNVARSTAEGAKATLNLTRLDVEFATLNAYLDVATAKRIIAIAQANVDRLSVFSNTVHVLVTNQLRPGADASQADAQLALARTQLIQARANAEVDDVVLSNFIGTSPATIRLNDSQLTESTPQDTPLGALVADHPAARQEAAAVNQQQEQLSVLTRSYVPQFTTQAAVSGRGAGTSPSGLFPRGANGLEPDTLNWVVGIQVTFPAFEIFSLRERKKVQEANVRAEQARYEQTIDDLSAEALQAKAQFTGAVQIAQNTPVELKAARENETQQRARFQSGLATVVEVAAAESVLVQAESDDTLARLNAWRAFAAMVAARGDLKPFLDQLAKQP